MAVSVPLSWPVQVVNSQANQSRNRKACSVLSRMPLLCRQVKAMITGIPTAIKKNAVMTARIAVQQGAAIEQKPNRQNKPSCQPDDQSVNDRVEFLFRCLVVPCQMRVHNCRLKLSVRSQPSNPHDVSGRKIAVLPCNSMAASLQTGSGAN